MAIPVGMLQNRHQHTASASEALTAGGMQHHVCVMCAIPVAPNGRHVAHFQIKYARYTVHRSCQRGRKMLLCLAAQALVHAKSQHMQVPAWRLYVLRQGHSLCYLDTWT